jgi:hypothetical protein
LMSRITKADVRHAPFIIAAAAEAEAVGKRKWA